MPQGLTIPDTIINSDAPDDVIEVYKILKKILEDNDRQWWLDNIYHKGWKAAYENEIWTDEEKKIMTDRGQVPISVNDLSKKVQGSSAIAIANKPGIDCKPVGSSDLYVSELFKRAIDYVWTQNQGNLVMFETIKENKISGFSCVKVEYDVSKGIFGKLVFTDIDPTEIYFDKDSKKADKSDVNMLHARLIKKSEALEKYDGLTEEDLIFNPAPKDDEGDETKSNAGNPGEDEYARATENKEFQGTTKEPKNVWEIEAWLIKKEKEFWIMIQKMGPDGQPTGDYDRQVVKTKKEADAAVKLLTAKGTPSVVWPRRVEKRYQKIVVGKKMISEIVNPHGVDSDGDPVVPLICFTHDRTLRGYPTSPTYRGLEITRSANKRRIQSVYVVSKGIDALLAVPAGQYKITEDKRHGSLLEIDQQAANFQVQRVGSGTSSAEFLALLQKDEQALNDEFDMQDVMVGKFPQGDPAKETVMALQEMGGAMSRPFMLMVESGLEKLGKCIISVILKQWPRSQWERLIEPEELGTWQPQKDQQVDPKTGEKITPPEQEIQAKWQNALEAIRPKDPTQPPGLSLLDLDVRIIAGSTAPTNRMLKSMVAIEKVKANIYPPEIALEYEDDPLKDKAIALIQQKAQNQGAPEKISYTVSVGTDKMPPEAQAQILEHIGVAIRPEQAQQTLPTGGA